MRPRHVCLALVAMIMASPSLGRSAVPSPSNSTIPCVVTACPLGDMPITVIVRDLANNPVLGSNVVIDFGICPMFVACPSIPGQNYIWDAIARIARVVTGADGVAVFNLRGGGGCQASQARIYADGVFLGALALASPDQDGDLAVTPGDHLLFDAKVGGVDPTGDFDCNGTVTATDYPPGAHLGHSCADVTSAGRGTWGRLKTIYRH